MQALFNALRIANNFYFESTLKRTILFAIIEPAFELDLALEPTIESTESNEKRCNIQSKSDRNICAENTTSPCAD